MGLPILGDNDKEPTETSVQIAGVVHEEVPDTQVHYDDVSNNADVEPEHESNRSTPCIKSFRVSFFLFCLVLVIFFPFGLVPAFLAPCALFLFSYCKFQIFSFVLTFLYLFFFHCPTHSCA